ncbi:YfiR/HmsC family protein [Colwellia echini]|uniref:histidine kinase n=1 Tax=Colwellia echini TaxID=1982103 RepID=A0ABY3MW67_9GAMM|nr:YfiR/HmsC family protein [Colwellia echini]TYK65461.1 DUF4154 domain-containing protein [Colwellia echini]
MILSHSASPAITCKLAMFIKVTFLSIMLIVPSYAQTANSVELLKVVWVYKFLNYITWPDEENTNNITISYWGGDSVFYDNLLGLNGKRVRDNQISIVRQGSISPQKDVQVIVVGKNNNGDLAKLQSLVKGENILVISDDVTDKQHIMINFVYPDPNSISFELNRYNIIYEKLALSSDILVIGGTEIDIAQVLNEMNSKLDKSRLQLDKRERTLTALASEISEKEHKMASLQQQIVEQTQDIDSRQQQYLMLKNDMEQLLLTVKNSQAQLVRNQQQLVKNQAELKKNNEELKQNNLALVEKQNKLIEKERDIEQLSQAIAANKLTLVGQSAQIAQQKVSLSSQEASLLNQEKELLNKTSTIQRQNMVMVFSLIFILLALGIVFVLYKSSKNKKKSYEALSDKNNQLAQTNGQLLETQFQLVESEKMAALGNLVAGVAHEINTPLGTSVTAVSTAQHLLDIFMAKVQANKVSRTDMNTFLEKLNQATGLINNNLIRANDLIRQFKLVAVDQSSEEQREFLLGEYLNEVLSSLYPEYKKYNCEIDIICDEELTMNSYPGGIAQIMTNLVINSILHGFKLDKDGAIQLNVSSDDKTVIITYQDNGIGIEKGKYTQIFTPFYTTKRNNGGSGLGMHICYNIARKLGGDIKCVPCDSGAKFVITLLKNL